MIIDIIFNNNIVFYYSEQFIAMLPHVLPHAVQFSFGLHAMQGFACSYKAKLFS